MKCFSPYLSRQVDGRLVGFPCGHCASCRRKKANEWAFRIALEARMYQHIAFITLTYSNEHLPPDFSLVPSHLSDFIKRLRTYLGRNGFTGKIRYFGCGEYGEQRKRPHYHLVIFNLPPQFFHVVKEAWKLGIIDIQIPRSSDQVASYVGGYVVKKMRVSNYRKDGREPPFSRQSQGLGWTFANTLPCYTSVLKVGNHVRYIGRYLRNKLADKFGVLEQVKKDGLRRLAEFFEDICRNVFHIPPWHLPSPYWNEKFLDAWQAFFSGDMELLKARNRLFHRAFD